MLEALQHDPFFSYIEINGEQPVEAVAADMQKALAL
jgi:hypothetical protein